MGLKDTFAKAISSTPGRLAKLIPRRAPTDSELLRVLDERTPPAVRSLFESIGVSTAQLFSKQPRTIIPEAITTYGVLQDPPYDPFTLELIATRHWVVRTCIDKLVRESTRKGYHWEPIYETRCDACAAEYDYVPINEKCPECGGGLEEPDSRQLVRVKSFLEYPNPQKTMKDILKANATDLLTYDDFYVSIVTRSTSAEIWPEDVRHMRIASDAKGRLGGKTFCPLEADTKKEDAELTTYAPQEFAPGSPCPKGDGGILETMAYAQVVGDRIVAAFKKEDVLHDNLFAKSTRLYGAPKLWAVQTQIMAMSLIDTYQKDSFEKAKTPKNIFVVKGLDDGALGRLQMQFEEAKKLNPMADFWLPVPAMAGDGNRVGIEKIQGIETPLITGSLAFQEYYFRAICYTFGVDPASVGQATPGRLGNADENAVQGGVSQEAIQEIQVQLSEAWDRFLKSRFSEIKDWRFTLETAYEKEESEIWLTKKVQMEAAKIAVDAGFNVDIDETGEPKISGSGSRQELLPQFGGGNGKPEEEEPELESKATAVEIPTAKAIVDPRPVGSVLRLDGTVDTESDFEKASRWQRELTDAAKRYKVELNKVAEMVFGRLLTDFDDVLVPGPVETVTTDLRDTLVSRSRKILELAAKDAAPMLESAAQTLYAIGLSLGLRDVGVVQLKKQDLSAVFQEDDIAAIEAFYARTEDLMKNVLYFGDKQTYLTQIRDTIETCLRAGGCNTRILMRRLQETLDPEKEHFSDYMWERIARTETSAYITAGRIKAYEQFEIPKVRRIVTIDERTDPVRCLPFSNAVYKVEDAYEVVPSHPNCRCAWAPYLGPEEPLDESQILRNA